MYIGVQNNEKKNNWFNYSTNISLFCFYFNIIFLLAKNGKDKYIEFYPSFYSTVFSEGKWLNLYLRFVNKKSTAFDLWIRLSYPKNHAKKKNRLLIQILFKIMENWRKIPLEKISIEHKEKERRDFFTRTVYVCMMWKMLICSYL